MKTRKALYIYIVLMFISPLFFTGCADEKLFQAHTVKNQEDAGTVNLTATLIAPWEDYVEAMKPNFTLSSNDALSKVIPKTSILEEKVIDALAAKVGIGLPQTSTTSTRTTSVDAEGVSTSTSQETREKKPGDNATQTDLPKGYDKGVATLPGIANEKKGVSNDPMLEYQVATALYQEVQLLNRYVTDAALKRGYKPYVVRLQLNVVPYARNQPYDVYATLGFFSKYKDSNDWKDGPVSIVPLLVTDNLEGTLKSRSLDTIRQFALALSFMSGGIKGDAGLNKMKENLDSVLGTDLNSLMTVGRITDSAIQVRLGAANQATAKYAMIPRTHNITVLVMVPEGTVMETDASVRVVSNVVLRHVESGQVLSEPKRSSRIDEIKAVLKGYFEGDIPRIQTFDTLNTTDKQKLCEDWHSRNPVKCTDTYEEFEYEAIDELLFQIYANNYEKFVETLNFTGWNKNYATDLWLEIIKTLSKSGYSSARIDLPKYPQAMLPPSQTVFLIDDKNSDMKTQLIGGNNLVGGALQAKLTFTPAGKNKQKERFFASSVSMKGNNGGNPLLTFPSLAKWKMVPAKDGNTMRLTGATLELQYVGFDKWESANIPKPDSITFDTIVYVSEGEAPKPLFNLRKTVETITSKAGDGEIKLYLEFNKDANKKQIADKVEIVVENAEIKAATDENKGDLHPKLGKVTMTQDGEINLELRNLDNAKKVLIKSKSLDSTDKPVGGDHDDLSLAVKASS